MHITEDGRQRHILDVNTEVNFVQVIGLNLSNLSVNNSDLHEQKSVKLVQADVFEPRV